MLTESQIRQMMPLAGQRLNAHIPYIGPALEQGGIVRTKDIAAFMAQLAQESGEYKWMKEIWGPTPQQLTYEGRADLGNTQPGDGYRFMGRGAIQNTGRAVYRAFSAEVGYDFEADPEAMESPVYATRSAVWFWTKFKKLYSRTYGVTTAFLPVFARMDWFVATTKGVNGGYTHLEQRVNYWNRNRTILGLPYVNITLENESIRQFQSSVGLYADGVAGPDTAAKAAEWLRCNL